MARRNPQAEAGSKPQHSNRSTTRHPVRSDESTADLFTPGLDEFARRAALGSLALLVVARAYYPSEDAETGSGLVWVLLLLMVTGLAIVANLVTGVTRFRWSWVDLSVVVLVVLVGFSAGHAADRRAAITMAWEWGGMGLLYLLTRSLPRTRAESSALGLVLIATAVAVATYGLYQASVEFPVIRHQFEQNPAMVLAQLGITPGTASAESFKQRLMYSNEPFSTFALANSLAGFIVGPLLVLMAIGLANLRREGGDRPWWGLALSTLPGLALLVCLLLTKSRSAYVGFLLGLVILAWANRSVVPRRWLIGVGVGLGLLLTALVGVGVASRQLDIQILSEAKKSLGYRWEYWVGTWGIITGAPSPFAPDAHATGGMLGIGSTDPQVPTPPAFWWGVGPANFASPYLQHKLPQASEEIKDPHNALLEVWSEAGFWAMLAFGIALVGGAALILVAGQSRTDTVELASPITDEVGGWLAPKGTGWLVAMGGLGWFGVWALGQLNPVTQADMTFRWLVLGASWMATILLVGPIATRRGVPAVGMGAAFVALAVELQAAGGIGVPSVAMVLWLLLALGLNLREDRPSGRLRAVDGLGPGVVLACGWAVLAGTFYGAVIPGWRSDMAVAEGEAAMASKPTRFEVARNAFARAIELDRYSVRPWLGLAELEYLFWKSPEAKDKYKTTWTKVLLTLDKALEGKYRDPDSLELRRRQVNYARLILSELPNDAKPFELLGLKSTIAKASRQAVRIYPTSASLRAELAQASADLGMYPDAVAEAKNALQLDRLMPHADKKLSDQARAYLTGQIERWGEQAKTPPPQASGSAGR